MTDKKENIEIKVEAGIKELVIRHGDAEKLHEPKKVILAGTIDAPAEFFRKRPDQVKKEQCHVLFSFRDKKIVLVLDEKDPHGGSVTGRLISNPELDLFKINSKSSLTIQDLKELFKTGRGFFASADENQKAITNLEKFRLSANVVIEKDNDNRGNVRDLVEATVKTSLDLSFKLNMPIFIGQPAKTFLVEILFDVRDKGVTVWLDSPELRSLIIEDREKIIGAALEPFKKDFVVIEE